MIDAGFSDAPIALVIAAGPDQADIAEAALDRAGIRLAASIRPEQLAARLTEQAALDVIALELAGIDDDTAEDVLATIADAAERGSVRVIAGIAPAQIDLAHAMLAGPSVQLLCNEGLDARVEALVRAAEPGARLHDASRDTETERLRRLNEEVARIAATLAELTRIAVPGPAPERVRAKATGFRAEGTDDAPDVSAVDVRAAIRARRLRSQFFAEALFADPAWDMLLDLYAAHLDGVQVSVSSLCIAAAVPPTTALRWISTLHDAGLFERRADPSDRRRAYIALSDTGLSAMRDFLAATRRSGLAIP